MSIAAGQSETLRLSTGSTRGNMQFNRVLVTSAAEEHDFTPKKKGSSAGAGGAGKGNGKKRGASSSSSALLNADPSKYLENAPGARNS